MTATISKHMKDRTGHRYGRLIVQSLFGVVYDKKCLARCVWRCKCDCGNLALVPADSLQKAEKHNRGTRSCGCLRKQKAASKESGRWSTGKQNAEVMT